MANIHLSVDRDSVNSGDFFTVNWQCENPDMVVLKVSDGVPSTVHLSDSGSRVVRASGQSDRITVSIIATVGGKKEEVSKVVKVSLPKAHRAERVDSVPRSDPKPSQGSFSGSKERKPLFDTAKLKAGYERRKTMLKATWSLLPADKKVIVEVLGLLLLIDIVSAFVPRALPIGVLLLSFYLIYKLLHRSGRR